MKKSLSVVQRNILVIVNLLTSFTIYAQVDQGFRVPPVYARPMYSVVFEQGDQKIIIGGNQSFYGTKEVGWLVRVSPSGALDQTFQSEYYGFPEQIISLQDKSLLIIGASGQLTHLTKNGAMISEEWIGASRMLLLPNNKVMVATNGHLYRYNSDLTIDDSFADGEGSLYIGGTIYDMTLHGNNVILGGNFTQVGNREANYLARIHQNGTFDENFVTGVGPSSAINKVVVQRDGKILLGGGPYYYDNQYLGGKLPRLNPNGKLDNTFNTFVLSGYSDFNVTSNNRVLITVSGGMFALNSKGSIDSSFKSFEFYASNNPKTFMLTGDQFITINERLSSDPADCGVHRFSQSGVTAKTFDLPLYKQGFIFDVEPVANEKIIVGGDFTKMGNTTVGHIVRLNKNGSIDPAFKMDRDPGIILQIDKFRNGSLLINSELFVKKYNSNGTQDTRFNLTASSFDYWAVRKFKVMPDDKILVNFYYPHSGISRRNSDGSLDNSFTEAVDDNDYDSNTDFDVQQDGKIIFVGSFTKINGVSVSKGIARLNSNGILDNTFNAGSGIVGNWILQVTVLSDQNIFIQGDFTSFDGQPSANIAKVSSDGSLIPSFRENWINAGLNTSYFYLSQPATAFRDGLFHRAYNANDGYDKLRWIDNSGYDQTATCLTDNVFSEGSIVIDHDKAYLFSNVSVENSYKSIVRLSLEEVSTFQSKVAVNSESYQTFPNPSSDFISFDTSVPMKASIYGFDGSLKLDGKVNSSRDRLDVSKLPAGRYIIRKNVNGRSMTEQLIKN